MSKHQKGKRGEPRHVRLYYWMMDSAAWKDLNTVERSVYVELSYQLQRIKQRPHWLLGPLRGPRFEDR